MLTARAMKEIGDLDEIKARVGLVGAAKAVLLNPKFMLGVLCMASGFYSLLAAVSFSEVSLVAPAAAALTFLTNAAVAKLYLKENVNSRRWASRGMHLRRRISAALMPRVSGGCGVNLRRFSFF